MNPVSKSPLPTVPDPFSASVIAQLREQADVQKLQLDAKGKIISAHVAQLARKDQALHAAEQIIQQLKEALRLKRIKEFGKQSEKLSDLQLELLAGEPGVSREEVAG